MAIVLKLLLLLLGIALWLILYNHRNFHDQNSPDVHLEYLLQIKLELG